jgi:hypothetical protein
VIASQVLSDCEGKQELHDFKAIIKRLQRNRLRSGSKYDCEAIEM